MRAISKNIQKYITQQKQSTILVTILNAGNKFLLMLHSSDSIHKNLTSRNDPQSSCHIKIVRARYLTKYRQDLNRAQL